MRPLLHASLALSAMLLAGGCKDREITSYRAPKDPAPAGLAAAAPAPASAQNLPEGHPPVGGGTPAGDGGMRMANVPVPTAGGANNLTWTAPSDWTPKTGSSMRRGSFAVKGPGGDGDLAITAFPGDTGGLHANLNRWRGQVGLPPASPAELEAAIQRVDAQGGLQFIVVDYTGTAGSPPPRLLGAIVAFEGNSWFFKLTGPETTVAAEKARFLDFLKTVKAP